MKAEAEPADRPHNVIGLMSGTSSDGVSACLVEIAGNCLDTRVELRACETYPYERPIRETVLALTNTTRAPAEDVARLNVLLGRIFAGAARDVAQKAGVPLEEVDLIGSHGHTIIHRPRQQLRQNNYNNETGETPFSFTLQIGEPSVIAQETGVTTVADFRMRDVAAGGSGAPLVPYTDYILLRHSTISRAVQNVGGIANVTFLPHDCTINDVIAFDTGPGNMIMDRVTQIITDGKHNYDDGGRLAEKGRVDETLLSKLMHHPYLAVIPPKSTGREDFGTQFTDKLYKEATSNSCDDFSILATVTAFTARSIAEGYKRFITPRHKISEVILCGGGSKNYTLMKFLKKFLATIPVRTIDELGIPSQAKEPLSFAVLANETICGNPGNIPNATGARERVVLGKIIPGRNWKDIIHM
ncbi:MAG: anhydro-N-acetylmuramic acid kinase [Candidatus Brocadiales bacterium]|nr:anhydro-N-acetylmuramic acid kinase [Candidatus Bathyanammoxibius amoris]